jgi:hypothetical protein
VAAPRPYLEQHFQPMRSQTNSMPPCPGTPDTGRATMRVGLSKRMRRTCSTISSGWRRHLRV